MSLSPENLDDILVSLELLAEQRLLAISDTRDERDLEKTRHSNALDDLAQQHRNANRVLVQAVEAAHERGVPKSVIYQRIGLSSQRLSQIKRALIERDR